MIPRPTTPQLLRDVRRELTTTVAPEVRSETARVALEQIDIVLEMCAVRSDQEIAWMVEEISEMDDFVARVAASTDDVRTADALVIARQESSESLALDAVCDDYNRLSEALSCAIEACMALPGQDELLAEGIDILTRHRSERETVARANWRLVGRG